MIHAKIENIDGQLVIKLDEADLVTLGVTIGSTVAVEGAASDAVETGKAFVERYIKTFEALAK